MLTTEEIQERYDRFMSLIKEDSRATELLAMYEIYGQELVTAPASGKIHFHNAFVGGYIDHILRVYDIAMNLSTVYKKFGGTVDFTKQELVFAALHHDLGKLGHPEEGPYYLEQDSDWHRKRGEMYKHNETIQYMKAPERGLMLLQKYGVKLTDKEWLAIRLSDGVYDEGAKDYLKNFLTYPMKTSLHNIIHWADHMASQAEKDTTKF